MVSLLTLSACAVLAVTTDNAAEHRFQGDSLPVPPQQKAPWNPSKSQLSSRLIYATRTLFSQGLADPRGCEYREYQPNEARLYVGASVKEAEKPAHGWILAAAPRSPLRFAIGWDGLIYPIAKIGPKTDLRADVLKECSDKGETAVALALLLRLGEAELAEKGYRSRLHHDELYNPFAGDARLADNGFHSAANHIKLYDPYLPIAEEWTKSLYDRAMQAHHCGDDRMALLTARELVPIMNAVEAEADRLEHSGLELFDDFPVSAEVPASHLKDLQPVRAILVDQERRAAERKKKGIDVPRFVEINSIASSSDEPMTVPAEPAELAAAAARHTARFWQQAESKLGRKLDNRARIAMVIQWFEDVSDDNSCFPEIILSELLRPCRDEAIEPLLDCLVNDTRLTRTFGEQSSNPGTASEMALVALDYLLDEKFEKDFSYSFEDLTVEGRKAFAQQIREQWKKKRKMPAANSPQ